ncbi:hypothetical protein KR074_000840, partial [Drosophila pseudoananassae]
IEIFTVTCNRKPDYGKCKGRRSLWYFNIDRKKCLKFVYSNCGGNGNRFFSRVDCEEYCKGIDTPMPMPQKRTHTKA